MEPGRDDRLLPDNISFCKFVHRPMASGSCLSCEANATNERDELT